MLTGLERMLDDMPENRNIYKDSGCWYIYDDDRKNILYEQGANENTLEFFQRAYDSENCYKNLDGF